MNKIIGTLALVALVLATVAIFRTAPSTPVLGGTTNFDALTLDNGNLTLTKGNIVVSNTSTSSLAVGCVQTTATSSATTIKLLFGTVATTTGNGFVLWQYGTCP